MQYQYLRVPKEFRNDTSSSPVWNACLVYKINKVLTFPFRIVLNSVSYSTTIYREPIVSESISEKNVFYISTFFISC